MIFERLSIDDLMNVMELLSEQLRRLTLVILNNKRRHFLIAHLLERPQVHYSAACCGPSVCLDLTSDYHLMIQKTYGYILRAFTVHGGLLVSMGGHMGWEWSLQFQRFERYDPTNGRVFITHDLRDPLASLLSITA